MSTPREQIIQATCFLLEKQGFPATGLNEIVRKSGAPKGSLYHYFPEGKEQLVCEAARALFWRNPGKSFAGRIG